jgi:hypothetical protein
MYVYLGFWTLSIVLYSKKKVAFWIVNQFPSSDERVTQRLRTPVFSKHFGFHLSVIMPSVFIFIHPLSVVCIVGLLEATVSRDMISSHPKIGAVG